MSHTQDAGLGEFEIILQHFDRPLRDRSVIIGIGDDAALVHSREDLVFATDTLLVGNHFLESLSPDRLARRALAVNLSDLAAMGADPRWFTLALTLPNNDPDWVAAFADALHATAESYSLALIGGDLTRGPLSITMNMIGAVAADEALRRSGAHPGESIFVTGTIGDAAAGLQIAKSGDRAIAGQAFLLDRFELPTARIQAGIALRNIASAAIDISDGLLADLGHLCKASQCGAVIEIDQLPLSEELQAVCGSENAIELALNGGDDYELCFTAPADQQVRIGEVLRPLGIQVTRIGECTAERKIALRHDGASVSTPASGFQHF